MLKMMVYLVLSIRRTLLCFVQIPKNMLSEVTFRVVLLRAYQHVFPMHRVFNIINNLSTKLYSYHHITLIIFKIFLIYSQFRVEAESHGEHMRSLVIKLITAPGISLNLIKL